MLELKNSNNLHVVSLVRSEEHGAGHGAQCDGRYTVIVDSAMTRSEWEAEAVDRAVHLHRSRPGPASRAVCMRNQACVDTTVIQYAMHTILLTGLPDTVDDALL